jgi:hypothetical protein
MKGKIISDFHHKLQCLDSNKKLVRITKEKQQNLQNNLGKRTQ